MSRNERWVTQCANKEQKNNTFHRGKIYVNLPACRYKWSIHSGTCLSNFSPLLQFWVESTNQPCGVHCKSANCRKVTVIMLNKIQFGLVELRNILNCRATIDNQFTILSKYYNPLIVFWTATSGVTSEHQIIKLTILSNRRPSTLWKLCQNHRAWFQSSFPCYNICLSMCSFTLHVLIVQIY